MSKKKYLSEHAIFVHLKHNYFFPDCFSLLSNTRFSKNLERHFRCFIIPIMKDFWNGQSYISKRKKNCQNKKNVGKYLHSNANGKKLFLIQFTFYFVLFLIDDNH